jgi:hypothetical protein
MLNPKRDSFVGNNGPLRALPHAGVCRCSSPRLEELLVLSVHVRDVYDEALRQSDNIQLPALRDLFDRHYNQQLRLVNVMRNRLRKLGREDPSLAGSHLQRRQFSYARSGRILPLLLLLDLLDAHDRLLAAARTSVAPQGGSYKTVGQDLAIAQVVRVNNLQIQLIREQLITRWYQRPIYCC